MRIILAGFTAALLLGGCPASSNRADTPDPDTLLIFHNNTGPMCLAALDWLAGVQAAHPAVTIEEHLTYEPGETARLLQFERLHAASRGVSESFEYLPIIFFRGQAFSGFNDEVAQTLEALLAVTENGP
jgi:hypothetical protein